MARDDVPQLASTAWGKTPAVARTARGRQVQALQAEARQKCHTRRERLLKHEWAQKRLCAIFGYKNAAQWNGYLPPATDPLPATGAQIAKPNTSPHRASLVRLLNDIVHFEKTGQLPDYAVESDGDGEG